MKYLLILLTAINFSFNLSAQNQDSVNYELRKIYFDSLIRVSDEINLVLIKPEYAYVGSYGMYNSVINLGAIDYDRVHFWKKLDKNARALLFTSLTMFQNDKKYCRCAISLQSSHAIEFKKAGEIIQFIEMNFNNRYGGIKYLNWQSSFVSFTYDQQIAYLRKLFVAK